MAAEKPVRAVIFDLFDTLVELSGDRHPYLRLCQQVDARDRLRECLTTHAPTLLDFCQHLEVEAPPGLPAWQAELDADVASARAFPETIPVLNTLRRRGLRVGLISNLASPYRQVCTNLGLDQWIDASVFSCDLGIVKPQPAIYQHALQELGVAADQTLMVGNGLKSDVQGPSACGIRALLLDRRNQSRDILSIRSLEEVEGWLN